MFGSGFAVGFTMSDLQTGVNDFIALDPVKGVFVAVLVLMFVPLLVRTLKSPLRRR